MSVIALRSGFRIVRGRVRSTAGCLGSCGKVGISAGRRLHQRVNMPGKLRKITEEQVLWLVAEYRSGTAVSAIASQLGVQRETVRDHLRRRNELKSQKEGRTPMHDEASKAKAAIRGRRHRASWTDGKKEQYNSRRRTNTFLHLKRADRHGLTAEELTNMQEAAGGKCGTCPAILAPGELHCHETGQVRGLLCGNCNRALGLVHDSIPTLLSMVTYLTRNAQ